MVMMIFTLQLVLVNFLIVNLKLFAFVKILSNGMLTP